MGRYDVDNIMEGFDNLRASYQLGEENRFMSRLKGVNPAGSGADYHYRNQALFLKGIERAREFERSNMLIAQGVSRLVDNVLQDGIVADPATGDTGVDAENKARWLEWSTNPAECDAREILTFEQMGKLTLRSIVRDGDVLHLPLRDEGALQPIEAHRLLTPNQRVKNTIHGVRVDPDTGRPMEYMVVPEAMGSMAAPTKLSEAKRYSARDEDGEPAVFHVFNPQRFSQTRGISAFNPVTYAIGMHDDLQFANLVRAQLSAFHALFRELPVDFAGGAAPAAGAQHTEAQGDGTDRFFEELAPGMIRTGRPGEKFNFQVANVPNPSFFDHAMLTLTIIAVNLGLPLAVMLLDPTKTNFSGWRGAIDQARMGFRGLQNLMITQFHAPVYRWKVRQWIAEDVTLRRMQGKAGVDLLGVKWRRPRFAYIEPKKDAEADALRIEKGLTSPRRAAAERGEDYDEIVVERVADQAQLFRAAMTEARQINKEYPEAGLNWRELIHLGDQIPDAAAEAQTLTEDDPAAAAERLEFEKEAAA